MDAKISIVRNCFEDEASSYDLLPTTFISIGMFPFMLRVATHLLKLLLACI